jgi:outer membrane protein TolC
MRTSLPARLVKGAPVVTMSGLLAAALVSFAAPAAHADDTSASPTGAPEPTPIGLREAIDRAAAGNIQLLKQNVAIRSAAGSYLSALGQFDVTLAGDASFSRSVNPPISATDRNSGSSYVELLDLSLSRALETGGNLTFALQGRGTTTTTPFSCGSTATATSCQIYAPAATLTFTQPILRGFGREITESNLRKARINKDLALLNRQAQASNALRDTIIAYWELAYQTQDLEIQRFAERLAREQLRTAEAQVQVGRMGELAAAAVHRAIATAAQAEAAAEQSLMGRALDLQRLFGIAVPRGFVGYRAGDALEASKREIDVDAETARAIEASPALKSIRMGLALTQTDVRVALESMQPQLNFVGSVSQGGRNESLSESFHQMTNPHYVEYAAGLNFALPFQNRAARGTAEIARAAADAAELDARDLELQVRDTVARMAAQIRSAGARLEYGRDAVRFSEDNLKAEMARFQVGSSTNNDVLLRQQELRQAQSSVARATADLLEAEVALEALTGDLLETYGITLR